MTLPVTPAGRSITQWAEIGDGSITRLVIQCEQEAAAFRFDLMQAQAALLTEHDVYEAMLAGAETDEPTPDGKRLVTGSGVTDLTAFLNERILSRIAAVAETEVPA